MGLLRDLRAAVDAYCEANDLRHEDVAEIAGMDPSALSRALAPGRPTDEMPPPHTVHVATAERIAAAIDHRVAVIPIEKTRGGRRR